MRFIAVVEARRSLSLSLSILSAERSRHLYPSCDQKLTWPHASFVAARQLRLLLRLLLARSAWRALHHDTCKRARFESHDAVYVISLPHIGARHSFYLYFITICLEYTHTHTHTLIQTFVTATLLGSKHSSLVNQSALLLYRVILRRAGRFVFSCREAQPLRGSLRE